MAEDKEETGFSGKNIGIIIFLCVFIIALWFCNWYFVPKYFAAEFSDAGTFGDMFGFVNSLFSGLAFAGIIITIFMQYKELKLQRTELEQTRKEFNIQNKTLKLQRFENTFFNMLTLHHQIVSEIDHTYYKDKEVEWGTRVQDMMYPKKELVRITGRDVFRYSYEEMRNEMMENPEEHQNIYLEYFDKYHTDFGHYFRNLYRMIKTVDQAKPEDYLDEPTAKKVFEFKYKYTSIIRSQLSSYEMLWLFYNCLSVNGSENFKPLIERYSLLKNVPLMQLADKAHENLYESSAFENQNKNILWTK